MPRRTKEAPLSVSLSLFLVESSVDSQPGAYCASRESFARQIDIFRGTLVCAQEEEEHGVCTRSRRLARRSWDSWKLRERRTEETPQSAFPEKLESSPLRGAATWAEEVEKSPRFFTLWKEKRVEEEKALERGRSCLGFASSWWKSACVRDAFLVTDPSFPFFHPD